MREGAEYTRKVQFIKVGSIIGPDQPLSTNYRDFQMMEVRISEV